MSNNVDSIFRTRSLGAAASGITDQYADGKAAKLWKLYIGDSSDRTQRYKSFLAGILKERNCKTVLDVACGTGVDSVMLLEEGFHVTSMDASDKMLKQAYKHRWDRRKEEVFDKWIIEEGNWLNLLDDVEEVPEGGFDAIICMGNSFAHLPDFAGDQSHQELAINNFHQLIRPGGVLVIDHRNYDSILESGIAPKNNIYYNSQHIVDIKTSVLYVNNHPNLITFDYNMDVSSIFKDRKDYADDLNRFRLSYYPHKVDDFTRLLKKSFGSSSNHVLYADFKPVTQELNPAYYIHIIEKPNHGSNHSA